MSTASDREPWWLRRGTLLFAAAGLAVVIRSLVDLAGAPPGLYIDESSIGYNAWTIAHHGVDEHGATWPLYFRAFGEYKNPVYIYALAPLIAVFGATPTVVRLPAAIFGLITVFAIAGLARQVTGSRGVALAVLMLAAATPWLTLESRVGFEVISMVACLAVMLWCLSHVRGGPADRRWLLLAGVAAALAVFAYSVGRLEVALLVAASLFCFGRSRHEVKRWLWLVLPVAVAYVILAVWSLQHPGALTARLGLISIGFDNPPLATLINRFFANLVSYFGPAFLFLRGDENPRHNTGFGGMLLITSLPLLISGVVVCGQRFRQALPRFILAGLALGPVSAALTAESVPHALRDASSLPFLLATLVYGIDGLRGLLARRRAWTVALVAAMALETVAYNADLFGDYATRAALGFDSPELLAIDKAHGLAGGHTVWLSARLEQPYIQACFIALPAPPREDAGDASIAVELGEAGFAEIGSANPAALPLGSGDLLVLEGGETPPPGAAQLFDEAAWFDHQTRTGTERLQYVAVRVWQVP